MRTDVMTEQDAETAAGWVEETGRRITGNYEFRFPREWIPKTGLSAFDDDGKLLCIAILYLERSSGIAVCGWCMGNPANSLRKNYCAVKLLMAAMPIYARRHGATSLMTAFGNRGINRLLDEMGFITGDRNVEHKFIGLRV